jgi:predicted ribosome quality control (RQC) complex YloA/Tae2 family protein
VHQKILQNIVTELRDAITGGKLGKIFQLSRNSVVIDFRRRETGYLFVNTDPSQPRIYLIQRPVRELEKLATPPGEFAQTMRAILTNAKVSDIQQDENERVVRIALLRQEETGELVERVLVAQLTGRSANLLLLDAAGYITHTQRPLIGSGDSGQQMGDSYAPPAGRQGEVGDEPGFEKGVFESWSAAADNYYRTVEAERAFAAQAGAVRTRLRQEVSRLRKLQQHLGQDLDSHGDAQQHKRTGDLLLANISNAKRHGNKVTVKDFYSEGEPELEIEVEENSSLQAEAARYFARYGKAKRAAEQIAKRLEDTFAKLERLEQHQAALEAAVAAHDQAALDQVKSVVSPEKKAPAAKSKAPAEKIPGVRRYLSADGLEILVGRAARDNDHLTFRIARAQDLWLHAADYPGSHVIIRNPDRKDVPHRTIIEAAQLAAKFSQAGNDSKVDINYTQQKFVSRIKGAAPGLVRLSSFRTITVEPKESVERL